MAVKPEMVSKLEKLAALAPLIVLAWGALNWGMHTDAQVKVLAAHDTQTQTFGHDVTDRLARLEQGQGDTNRRLDRIQDGLDIIVRQTK